MTEESKLLVRRLDQMIEQAKELIQRDKGHWPETARATGLHREWIVKLAQGAIAEPGYRKIAVLHDYLSNKYAKQIAAERRAAKRARKAAA